MTGPNPEERQVRATVWNAIGQLPAAMACGTLLAFAYVAAKEMAGRIDRDRFLHLCGQVFDEVDRVSRETPETCTPWNCRHHVITDPHVH